MTLETENCEHLDPEIYAEILRYTDKKNYINKSDRILRKTIVELVKNGKATFLFIRDEETHAFWQSLVKDASAKVEKRREAWRLYELKQNAWDRLSEEDRKILKLRKPSKPRI